MTSMGLRGRYGLARLGWKSFEDVCLEILRVVLGETVVGFGPGGDSGRDGFFKGRLTGKLKGQLGDGTWILQCKHTSQDGSLTPSRTEAEIPKLKELVKAEGSLHYALMTNRNVTEKSEQEIRTQLASIPGIASVTILGESWIEDAIDREPRLLRLVPRLYGIGDLTQILAFPLEQQSRALFEEMGATLATFVPTESYRQAERLLTERGMVVLVGPPAAGKSTIAANLCAVWVAQTEGMRLFKLDRAEHFTRSWSPDDPRCIFWVDDVFGETTLDEDLLRDWSSCLGKLDAAARRGARVILGTRDYILAAVLREGVPPRRSQVRHDRTRVSPRLRGRCSAPGVEGSRWRQRPELHDRASYPVVPPLHQRRRGARVGRRPPERVEARPNSRRAPSPRGDRPVSEA
jgi:hypothetical protein